MNGDSKNNSSPARYRIEPKKSLWLRLSKWSSDPATVFIMLAFITVVTVLTYIGSHRIYNTSSENIICQNAILPDEDSKCLIIRDSNDVLKVNFIRNGLLASFSDDAIDAIQSEVDAFIATNRPILIRQRLDFLRSLASLESRLLADYFEAEVHSRNCIPTSDDGAPEQAPENDQNSSLVRCDTDKIALLEHPLPTFPSLISIAGDMTPKTATSSALELIGTSRLDPVFDLLTYLCYGNAANASAYSPCTVTQLQPYHERLRFELNQLEAIKTDEFNNWTAARNISANLQSDLDLDWLWIDNPGWVAELAFWCWFGVLTNTGFAIISALKQPDYSEEGFKPDFVLFMFPKLLFAPFIAIVVASFVLAGLTDFDLSLANAPVFLIFAFFSGFFSERFAEIVRSFFAIFARRLGPSAQKFEQAKRWQKIDYAAGLSEAESLSELTPILTKKAQQTAREKLAAGLVT